MPVLTLTAVLCGPGLRGGAQGAAAGPPPLLDRAGLRQGPPGGVSGVQHRRRALIHGVRPAAALRVPGQRGRGRYMLLLMLRHY